LWTGLIGIVIPSIISIVLVLVNIDTYRKSLQAAADRQQQHIIYTTSMVLTGLLINVLFLLILGILPGVIGGLLGGVFGSRNTQVPPTEEHKESVSEPPSTSVVEALPPESENEELTSTSVTEERPAGSDSEEQSAEATSEEPSSSTQPAE
jgi:hypothetical protein